MGRGRTEQTMRSGAGTFALMALALALGGCGSTSSLLKSSPLDLFSSSSKATNDTPPAAGAISADDIDCPEVQVRTGAATLMIGSKPGEGEPAEPGAASKALATGRPSNSLYEFAIRTVGGGLG